MDNVNTLIASHREKVGTNSTKKIRGNKMVPAIIYGDGKKPEPISISVVDLRLDAYAWSLGNWEPRVICTYKSPDSFPAIFTIFCSLSRPASIG